MEAVGTIGAVKEGLALDGCAKLVGLVAKDLIRSIGECVQSLVNL